MRCSLLHRRCWPCAATQTLLILWNLFLRDNPTARKRKTRPHASHGLVRNAYWGTNWIKCTHFSSLKPRGNLKTLLSLTQLLKKKISHLTQHFLYGLLDPDKEAVDGGEDRDQIAQRSGDSCRHPVCIVTKLQLTWTMQVSSSTGEWFSPFFFFFLYRNLNQSYKIWRFIFLILNIATFTLLWFLAPPTLTVSILNVEYQLNPL